MNQREAVDGSSTRPFTLVVATDLGTAGGFAFERSARVARRIPGSDLHIVHVVEKEATEEESTRLATQLQQYLEERLKAVPGLEQQAIGLHVRHGKTAHEIAAIAGELGADLIVVGAEHRAELKHLILGSVAESLLLEAPCPVFVAGPEPVREVGQTAVTIEPPCPDCELARRVTGQWWCARHSSPHAKAHSYSFHREIPLRTHDSSVEPTGVDIR